MPFPWNNDYFTTLNEKKMLCLKKLDRHELVFQGLLGKYFLIFKVFDLMILNEHDWECAEQLADNYKCNW